MSSLVDRLSTHLARRTSRRGFLARTAVVGAAMAADPVNYVLRPASAYSSLCGDGASCQSGWTAFCVTVNKGVNQCPPGSFTAGWWKADHASVCGGKARYYIDCNASCVGGHAGHYTCSCRCAPGHGCDKRRTCCNQFRYGQCHRETACYGPVVCRVVSCVAPWHWDDCSRTAATDNRTRNHSAPELPHHYDAIEQRYVALHGHASPLGASTGGRHAVRGGILQKYQKGVLVAPTGAAARMLVHTAFAYEQLGGPNGALGLPTVDEKLTRDHHGHLARLRHGAIYAWRDGAVHALHGPWLDRWIRLVDDLSTAGRPLTNAVAAADGSRMRAEFERALLMWSHATGTHLVSGADARRYRTLGAAASVLGYPTADTAVTADGHGTLSTFTNGVIVGRGPDAASIELVGAVATRWKEVGGVTGSLGYPLSGATSAAAPGASVVTFERGRVYVLPSNTTFLVVAPVLQPYLDARADSGVLGLPVDDAVTTASDVVQHFERGTITVDVATGQATVTTNAPPAG